MSLTIAASLDFISTKASSSLVFTFCVFLSLSLCPLLVVWAAGQMMVSTWLWGCSMESSAFGTKMARKKWRSSGLGAPSPRYGPSAGTLQGAFTAILFLGHTVSFSPCKVSPCIQRLLSPLDWYVLEPLPFEWNFLRAHLVFWNESQKFS